MADKVIGDYTAAVSIDGSTHYLLIQPGGSSTAYNRINRNVFLGIAGSPVGTSDSQVIMNKTIGNTNTFTSKDSLFTLQDDSDTTKQAQFQLSGITTGTTRTYTLPNASSTLADISTVQTLTNKTLTSPTITGGTIDNSTITVDSISGHTSATVVTVAGLQISSGVLNTNNSVVTANIADSAVTPAKLLAGTGSTYVWQSFTVTWTNLTIGNGTATGQYSQIGKTVRFRMKTVLGSTSVIGTDPSFTLPVTANSNTGSRPTIPYGQSLYFDTSPSAFYFGPAGVPVSTSATANCQPFVSNVSATYATSSGYTATIPVAFGTGDEIYVTGSYEAA